MRGLNNKNISAKQWRDIRWVYFYGLLIDESKSKVRSMIDNYAVLREKEGETKDVSVSLLRVLNISRTVT